MQLYREEQQLNTCKLVPTRYIVRLNENAKQFSIGFFVAVNKKQRFLQIRFWLVYLKYWVFLQEIMRDEN